MVGGSTEEENFEEETFHAALKEGRRRKATTKEMVGQLRQHIMKATLQCFDVISTATENRTIG